MQTKFSNYLFGFAFVSFLAIGYYGYWNATRTDRLFDDHFQAIPEADFGVSRALVAVSSSSATTKNQALRYQLDGRYDFALSAWTAYLEDYGEADQTALLYAATAALASGRNEQAEWYLDKITASSPESFVEEVKWYRALHQLKIGEAAAAESTLNKINTLSLSPRIRQQLPSLQKHLQSL